MKSIRRSAVALLVLLFATACSADNPPIQQTTASTQSAEATQTSEDDPSAPTTPAAQPTAVPDSTSAPEPTTEAQPTAAQPTAVPEPTAAAEPTAAPAADQAGDQVAFIGTVPDFPPVLVSAPFDQAAPPPVAPPTSSLASPVPMAGATFALDVGSFNAIHWDVTVHGFIESVPQSGSDEGSACWILLMTITPTYVEDQWGNRGIDAPNVGWVGDGQHRRSTRECADRPTAQGWFELGLAEAFTGAPIDVYHSFMFEGESDPVVEAIYIGAEEYRDEVPGDDDINHYLVPAFLDAVPELTDRVDLALPDAQPLADQQFVVNNAFVPGAAWTIHGVVEVESNERVDAPPGSCLVLVGESAPTAVDEGTVEDANGIAVELLAGGHFLSDSAVNCDTTVFEELGYYYISPPRTVGTAVSFMQPFFVPDYLRDEVTHITIGRFAEGAVQFFSVDIIDEAPPATGVTPDPRRPVAASPMDTPGLAWTDVDREVDWTISLNGLYDAGSGDDGVQCVVVTATVSPNVDVDSRSALPRLSLIAAGISHEGNAKTHGCDVEALIEMGWVNWGDFDEVAAGDELSLFVVLGIPPERLTVPSVFAVGSTSNRYPATYLDPVFVETVPAR